MADSNCLRKKLTPTARPIGPFWDACPDSLHKHCQSDIQARCPNTELYDLLRKGALFLELSAWPSTLACST